MMTQRNHKLLPSNILTSQLWTYFFKLIFILAPTIPYALRYWYCDDFVSEITDSSSSCRNSRHFSVNLLTDKHPFLESSLQGGGWGQSCEVQAQFYVDVMLFNIYYLLYLLSKQSPSVLQYYMNFINGKNIYNIKLILQSHKKY